MILFHLFVFIVAVSATKIDKPKPGETCGENAIWNGCSSPCHQRSCDQPGIPKLCAGICKKGYTCKLGYVKGPHGKCILKKDCPKKEKCSDPNEIWNECGSNCEEQCEKCDDPKVCTAVCVPKCSCKPGYVRGPGGNCVAKEDCHVKSNCSDPNAVWNKCGSNCEEHCEKPKEPRVCLEICIPKCTCKPGHVIGPHGKCIPKDHCPSKINGSDPNAIWNDCINPCNQLSCDDSDVPKYCSAVCQLRCSCKIGYITGPHGKCILKEDCPPKKKCLGQNEIWNECGSNCEEQCEEPEDPRVCPAVCVPKCSCKPGHVRGPDGKCIAKDDCPPKHNCSDPNAVWNECARPCTHHSCADFGDPITCDAVACLKQCTCKAGYLNGPDGKCILKEHCPPKNNCSDPNAVWNECGSNCEQHCLEPKYPSPCSDICIRKCTCKPGYVIGPDGNCIEKADCPPKNNCSDPNAVWNECGSNCEPHCVEPKTPIPCSRLCVPKCTCKPGYVIGPDGKCVAKDHCPLKNNCSDPNAVWNKCGSNCEPHCVEPKNLIACSKICVPKCTCKPGYVIGPDGKCVAKEHCPPKNNCSDPNAVWNKCGSNCEPHCVEPKNLIACTDLCVPKCTCKPGYVIGPDGKCVAKDHCPPKNNCSDPNAVWNKCGSNCEPHCVEPKNLIACTKLCVPKCTCKPGYVIGPDGKCVAKDHCPPKNNCSDPNAVWNKCGSNCEPHCVEPKNLIACTDLCVPKCTCKPGYVIGPDGKCVAKDHCPPKHNCSDPNAIWNECGSSCEKRCEGLKDPIVCPAVCIQKCTCKPGYVIGPDGNCIAKKDCPPKNNCSDPNAVWNECGSLCEPHCGDPKDPIACADICVPKCTCKPGYVIGPDGNCVAKKDCPPKNNCSDPNAVWNECVTLCEPHCTDPKYPTACADVCVAKCTCKPGYVIGPNGNCVAKKDCPPKNNCSDPNAVWNECGSPCEAHCVDPKYPIACGDICVPKCTCKPGYVIGPDGNCVAKKDCPPKNNCSDPNAYWNECGSDCEHQCVEPEDPRICPAVCVPKCSCKTGYVTGPDGKCVAQDDCPPKNNCSDPNAFWNECGSYCTEKKCEEPKEPIFCPAVCVKKCSCKPGYVIGPNGKCIAKKDCPPKKNCTDENEVWTECGSDCEEKCEKPKGIILCPAVCVPKCSCKPGLVRDPNGKCIPKKQCPKKCRGKNQFWNECGSNCEPTCDKSDDDRVCAAVCVKKCSCNPGYLLAKNGDCVKKEDCDCSSED